MPRSAGRRAHRPARLPLLLLPALVACHGDGCADRQPRAEEGLALTELIGAPRPAHLLAPRGLDPGDERPKRPLLLALHGYASDPQMMEGPATRYVTRALGALTIVPAGSENPNGNRFWNATRCCCDFFRQWPDDVAYLTKLIHLARQRYPVDDRRIYALGVSNGGFMAHRLACEHPELVAAVVSLSGAGHPAADHCAKTGAVSVVQVHGDADPEVPYRGGTIEAPAGMPPLVRCSGAVETVRWWAKRAGCNGELTRLPGGPLDLDQHTEGATSTAYRFRGCPAGLAVELWKIRGGKHVPATTAPLVKRIVAFLEAHPHR